MPFTTKHKSDIVLHIEPKRADLPKIPQSTVSTEGDKYRVTVGAWGGLRGKASSNGTTLDCTNGTSGSSFKYRVCQLSSRTKCDYSSTESDFEVKQDSRDPLSFIPDGKVGINHRYLESVLRTAIKDEEWPDESFTHRGLSKWSLEKITIINSEVRAYIQDKDDSIHLDPVMLTFARDCSAETEE